MRGCVLEGFVIPSCFLNIPLHIKFYSHLKLVAVFGALDVGFYKAAGWLLELWRHASP